MNSDMDKRHDFADCNNCPLFVPDCRFVPSYGPEQAALVVIGEAPGRQETVSGKPFSGPSGKLLRTVLDHHGIDQADVFYTNVCLCRPPENATPSKAAIAACAKRLQHEIATREPTTILALGNTAAAAVMGKAVKITSFRVGPPKESERYPGVKVVPTFHPAACLRSSDSFPHLVTDVGKIESQAQVDWKSPEYVVYDDYRAALAIREIRQTFNDIVIDVETDTDKDDSYAKPFQQQLLCVGLGYAPGKVVVIAQSALRTNDVQLELGKLIVENNVIAHNGRYDLGVLRGNIRVRGRLHYDTLLASYTLDERPGTNGLKYLAVEQLGAPEYALDIGTYTTGGQSFANIPSDILHRYNAYDVSCTFALWQLQRPELAASNLQHTHEFLVRASDALMDVEFEGVRVDLPLLDELEERFHRELQEAEKALYPWVDNPRSVPQVKQALEDMGYPVGSTDREQLEALLEHGKPNAKQTEFLTRMLSYRKESKLYTTYVKGLRSRLYGDKVFPSFPLHTTVTGRLSSRNPNLQNIPRGNTIRSLFIPEDGNVFLQADFAQIELRVVATLAEDEYLQAVLSRSDRDIFGELAQKIFGDGWTKGHRQIVKRIVHGSNYLMGEDTCAAQMNSDASNFGLKNVFITPQMARSYQEVYFSMAPKVREWQKRTKQTVFGDHSDLVTYTGRHRRFYLITKENRFDVEHEALAFVPQSTASDICLDALCGLVEAGYNVRIPVHDSILLECPVDKVQETAQAMEDAMMEAGRRFSTFVPYTVEVQQGPNWGSLT